MGERETNRLDGVNLDQLPTGKHCDGAGLWLIKRDDGGAQWVNRVTVKGKRRELGLGSAAVVSLQSARDTAARNAVLAKSGTVSMPDALTRISLTGKDAPELVALKNEYAEVLDAIDLATDRAKDIYARIASHRWQVK
tara:strand:- start:821 stop:1234 length:414 start_codon:yes stop_codon:yes gene_type:complete